MKKPAEYLFLLAAAAVGFAIPIRSPKDSANHPAPRPAPAIAFPGPIEPPPTPVIRLGEFWVSPYMTNALGTGFITGQGTPQSPYTGDFDAIMKGSKTNTAIHLGPGVFYTRAIGDWNLQTGQKMNGAGIGITAILRDPRWSYNQNQPVLLAVGDDISLSDLTIDAACTNGEPFIHNAITLFGDRPELRRLWAIRVSGKWPYLECFSYFICPSASDPASGGIISECYLSQVMGDYVEGFCVWGGAHVYHCTAVFPILTNNAHPPFFNGFQAAYSYGARFESCTQIGGSGVFYTDTGSDTDLTISGIFAFNVMQGVIIVRQAGQYIDGLTVDGCTIELSTNAQVSLGANGVAVSGVNSTAGKKTGTRISNNLIRYVGGARGPAENRGRLLAAAVLDGTRSGTVIQGNTWDSDFVWAAEPGATVATNNPAARATEVPSQ